ncbi:MAG: aminoacyl-tRNA hydrolase [Bdellovibrionales bacterium]|nr:aminoacyl-tRNA hydrolase [Bdellovibrionales bacterium]
MLSRERLLTEVEFAAVRSRGPGGQNVNKVSSAALLFWSFERSALLNEEQRALVREKMRNMINGEGQIYLRSDEFRDLQQNKERCLEKLQNFVTAALHKPKVRRPSRPTRASKVRKAEAKSRHSETKKNRQKLRYD